MADTLPICVDCGGYRSIYSAKRCRSCYVENSKRRKNMVASLSVTSEDCTFDAVAKITLSDKAAKNIIRAAKVRRIDVQILLSSIVQTVAIDHLFEAVLDD